MVNLITVATLLLALLASVQGLSVVSPRQIVTPRHANVYSGDYCSRSPPRSNTSRSTSNLFGASIAADTRFIGSNVKYGSTSSLFGASIAADASVIGATNLNVKYGPSIKVGKLKINLFGAFFGIWEIFWGLFYWYPLMTLYGTLRWISAKVPGDFMQLIDPYRRVPICIAYGWGLLSMGLFGLWPVVEGRENLEVLREINDNGKKGKLKPAMYVANHCSWMDIPYVCRVFGFQNAKTIAKAELLKVPILGRALLVAGHVTLDRTDRRSQMKAYKDGVQWLKDGVNLVTFPEGTRSKDGRLNSFKKGAFKMAQTAGAPVIPMSIHYADKIQPLDYAFPAKSSLWSRPKAVIKIGKPISTEAKTDDELLEEVWQAIANDLPECQKPLKDTPVGAK